MSRGRASLAALFLPALATYPLMQLGPHLWMLWELARSPADPLALGFILAALGADLVFFWLMLGFALAKTQALLQAPAEARAAGPGLPATVLIPVCDEPLEVLRPAFFAAAHLGHPVVVVENCRRPDHGPRVRDLARRCGLDCVSVPNRGTKAAALNAVLPSVRTPALVLLDADVVAEPDAADALIAVLAADPDLAFVQSPQAERNRGATPVAAAASCQQLYFYEFVAQGWGAAGRALCVGTQCAFRTEPLRAAGGFPEDTVTEDIAVSYALHRAGHRSAYLPRVLGRGLAPTTLAGFWRQRARHAQGAVSLLLAVLADHRAPPGLRLSYAAMAAFPLVAVGYLCFSLTLLLAAQVQVASWSQPLVYLGAAGAFVLTQALLLSGMTARGHRLAELLAGQGGTLLVLPAYLQGIARALIPGRAHFELTPKTTGHATGTWQGPLALCLALAGVAWATRWAARAWSTELGVLVFGLWLVFHAAVLLAPFLVATSKRGVAQRDQAVLPQSTPAPRR